MTFCATVRNGWEHEKILYLAGLSPSSPVLT